MKLEELGEMEISRARSVIVVRTPSVIEYSGEVDLNTAFQSFSKQMEKRLEMEVADLLKGWMEKLTSDGRISRFDTVNGCSLEGLENIEIYWEYEENNGYALSFALPEDLILSGRSPVAQLSGALQSIRKRAAEQYRGLLKNFFLDGADWRPSADFDISVLGLQTQMAPE